MKLFSFLYNTMLRWSGHRHAPYYLAGVSFAESSFFPIPPDVMLISMGLATPKRSGYYALIATIFSVMGGILGYVIGMFGMEFLQPYIMASPYAASYHNVLHWFDEQGVWIVFLAAFTPLPYKLFTITAGAMHLPFLPFVLGSFFGRGLRFFLVSGLLFFWGDKVENRLRKSVDILGWTLLCALGLGYLVYKIV